MLDENGEVFLCDFGCSEFFNEIDEEMSKATKGTPFFMAPEMFIGDKTKKVIKGPPIDIWAAGVTLFNLLTNKYPFFDKNQFALPNIVKNDDPKLELLGEGREELKSLFRKIFEKDPDKRIDIYELLDDPWVNDNGLNLVDLDMSNSSVTGSIG